MESSAEGWWLAGVGARSCSGVHASGGLGFRGLGFRVQVSGLIKVPCRACAAGFFGIRKLLDFMDLFVGSMEVCIRRCHSLGSVPAFYIFIHAPMTILPTQFGGFRVFLGNPILRT